MILDTAKASKKKWKNKWKGFSIMGLDIKWTATAQQASNSVNQSQSSELLNQHSQGQKCEWQKQAYVFLPINDSNKNNKVSDKLKRNCFCQFTSRNNAARFKRGEKVVCEQLLVLVLIG